MATRIAHRQHYRDIAAGLVVVGVSAWMWWVSAEFPTVPQRYNRVLIVGLVLLSLIQVVRSAVRLVLARRGPVDTETSPAASGTEVPGESDDVVDPRVIPSSDEPQGTDGRADDGWRRWVPAGALFVLGSLAYVWAVPRVGYLVSTAVFLVVGLGTAIGWRVRTVVTAIALSGVMYVILDRVVNATVPDGLLL